MTLSLSLRTKSSILSLKKSSKKPSKDGSVNYFACFMTSFHQNYSHLLSGWAFNRKSLL